MPKPTTGRIDQQAPEPDPDQMSVDTLMTSVFTGICLLVATVVLGTTGSLGLSLLSWLTDGSKIGHKVGLGLGLAVGMALIAWGLKHFSARIKQRSTNLYRGAWIGSVASLVIIVLMAYLPQVAFPQYCPPGNVCVNDRR